MHNLIISIVTNNSENVIEKCLHSIDRAIQRHSYKVCVIDNYSEDNTISLVKQYKPSVHLIESKTKQGFGANQNVILRNDMAHADYILILNDDVFLSEGSIDRLIYFLDQHPSVGAVCPSLYYLDGTPQISGTVLFGIEREILRITGISKIIPSKFKRKLAQLPQSLQRSLGKATKGYLANFEESTLARSVGYLSGACLLVRRSALEDVGLFDENFRMYYEDLDWGRRAHMKGWELFVVPTERAWHYTKHSMGTFSLVEQERSMFTYYKKYKYSRIEIIILALLTVIFSAAKSFSVMIRAIIFQNSARNSIKIAQAYAKIVRIGLQQLFSQ